MAADILARFRHVHQVAADAWTARCPAHEDARNSLSIGRGADGRWLLKCHTSCELADILAAAHLEISALFPEKQVAHDRRVVATYRYTDENGQHLYDVVRFEPKDFRQRAADGTWSIKNIRRVLYRLPELKGKAKVFITEGEKDADALWALGLPATTNAGGAGNGAPNTSSS